MRARSLAVVVAVVAVFASPSFAQNPVGTWKANIAKSKYSPGPAPKSVIITTTAVAGGSFKTVNVQMPADGKETKFEITYKFDGKFNPVVGANPNADAQSYTKGVDDHHWTVISKLKNTVTITSAVVLAADGQSRTTTQTGKDWQGKAVNNVILYEKQ